MFKIYIAILIIFSSNTLYASNARVSSCDTIPTGYKGEVFRIKAEYPRIISKPDFPWDNISYISSPEQYAYSVLNYIYQGNIDCNFNLYCNKDHQWYHALWMHSGVTGREFVHGLTRERAFKEGELGPKQNRLIQNWGLSIINSVGAYTYGQVWNSENQPSLQNVLFQNGTVSAKLIFTEANDNEIPNIKNSIKWTAYINESAKGSPKVFKQLRLMQIDFLVKDERAKETGWVAGTFIYDDTLSYVNPWYNMRLVGITWGNDPLYLQKNHNNKSLAEIWINPSINKNVLGYFGRLCGPADHKHTSCLSCHSTSQYPELSASMPNIYASEDEIARWFRNLNNESFDNGAYNLDYSKQLSHGISNYYNALKLNDTVGCKNFNKK